MWSLDTSTVRRREWHKKIISLFSSRFSLLFSLENKVSFWWKKIISKAYVSTNPWSREILFNLWTVEYEIRWWTFYDKMHTLISNSISDACHRSLIASVCNYLTMRCHSNFWTFSLDKQKDKCSHIETFRFDYRISAKSTRKWSCCLHLLRCPSLLWK